MKKLFLAALSLIVLITSCTKEKEVSLTNSSEQLTKDISEVRYEFENDYLSFESESDLSEFILHYQKLNPINQKELDESPSYVTLDSHIENLYDELDLIDNESQLLNFITKNNDILQIVEIEDGEKQIEEKDLSKHPISGFLNSDRIIKIENTFRKYIGNKFIESKSYDQLININTVSDIDNSELKSNEAYKTLIASASPDSRNFDHYWQVLQNPGKCSTHKRLSLFVDLISASIYFDNPTGPGGFETTSLTALAEVVNYKRNIICYWYKAKTNICWNDFDMELTGQLNGEEFDFPWVYVDTKALNVRKIKRKTSVGGFASFDDFSIAWDHITSTVSSDNVGNSWINACFPNGNCDHNELCFGSTPDPCADVICDNENEYCFNGTCVPYVIIDDIECDENNPCPDPGEHCVNGKCQPF